jgi:hypothetical protein
MPTKEFTLQELIVKQQETKASKLANNAENISKIQQRANDATGTEKVRLISLLKLHQDYASELEAIDPIAVATERFNKLDKAKSE